VNIVKEVKLPKPREKGSISIEETLNKRRSVRDYKKGPLNLEQVSQLLWAASGRNLHRKTAPSAGATYPYSSSSHSLGMTISRRLRRKTMLRTYS